MESAASLRHFPINFASTRTNKTQHVSVTIASELCLTLRICWHKASETESEEKKSKFVAGQSEQSVVTSEGMAGISRTVGRGRTNKLSPAGEFAWPSKAYIKRWRLVNIGVWKINTRFKGVAYSSATLWQRQGSGREICYGRDFAISHL